MLAQLNFACRKRKKNQAWSVPARERERSAEKPYGNREQGSKDEPEVLLVLTLTVLCSPSKHSWLSWAEVVVALPCPSRCCPRCLFLKAALAGNLQSSSRGRSWAAAATAPIKLLGHKNKGCRRH